MAMWTSTVWQEDGSSETRTFTGPNLTLQDLAYTENKEG